MRLLMLGNSNDTGDWFDAGQKRRDIIQARLRAEFGLPIEVEVRSLWPNERMTEILQSWLDELEPDFVYVNTTTFHFTYESLPLRCKRLFGRFGETAGDAGFKLASSKRWSHNRVFRGIRELGKATIGGDTHVTCDQFVALYDDAIRMMVRREGLAIGLKGPSGGLKPGLTKRQARRAEEKRLQVSAGLKHICDRHRVQYFGYGAPRWKSNTLEERSRVGDGLHADATGHRLSADRHYDNIRRIVAAQLDSTQQPAATHA